VVTLVWTGLCHGCPIPASVAAFGCDARTVAAWLRRAGQQGQQVQHQLGQQGQVDLQPVPADARWVQLGRRRVWMALALAVPSRLWLGGVISAHRALPLSPTRVPLMRSCARPLAIRVCGDGLAS